MIEWNGEIFDVEKKVPFRRYKSNSDKINIAESAYEDEWLLKIEWCDGYSVTTVKIVLKKQKKENPCLPDTSYNYDMK